MNNYETRQDHFVCSSSRKRSTEECDTHFIRAVVLEEGTLQNIQLVCLCISAFEDEFREALGVLKSSETKKELDAKRKMLQKAENRCSELDRLFKRVYEDLVNGNLSETRFKMLSDDYETEQTELKEKIELLNKEIQEIQEKTDNIEKFIRTAKKYVGIEELTPAILNDMVKAVYVQKPDKSSGKRVQKVIISYNYAGILPNELLNKFYSRCTQKETA